MFVTPLVARGKTVLCNSIEKLGKALKLINDVDTLSIVISVFGGMVSILKLLVSTQLAP